MDKSRIAAFLRRVRLVDVSYRAGVGLDAARNHRSNRRFRDTHLNFVFPPASLVFLTSGTSSYENYYDVGVERAHWLKALASDARPPEVRRVYEWGCGTGKTIRHLVDDDPGLEVYGSDYDERVIRWCVANIPKATFVMNGLEPPLPFEDDFFEILYSFSVYTHLPPNLQIRWLAEQLRVVRPGGLVSLSVHGDVFRDHLTPSERVQYESEGTVVHGGTAAGGPWFTTFNSPRWMEQTLLHGHDIVDRQTHREGRPTLQDVWVIRKPSI
jgi:SAM-dependent methyltransferase